MLRCSKLDKDNDEKQLVGLIAKTRLKKRGVFFEKMTIILSKACCQ